MTNQLQTQDLVHNKVFTHPNCEHLIGAIVLLADSDEGVEVAVCEKCDLGKNQIVAKSK